MKRVHYIDNYLINPQHPVTVNLIGAGGTGSQVLTCLARLDTALRGLGHPGLFITVYDSDIVTEANIGRQLFSPSDIGLNKAQCLVTRINNFFGNDWKAIPDIYPTIMKDTRRENLANITITCTDNIKSRLDLWNILKAVPISEYRSHETPLYWMDFGNTQDTGQVILGTVPKKIRQPASKLYETVESLKVITRYVKYEKVKEKDSGPSCSLAEALEKQDLFIESSRHITRLANSLLDLSRLDDAKETLNEIPFHLESFLESIAEEYTRKANDKGLMFDKAFMGCGITALGDADRIRQIVVNILENAVKFTRTGYIKFLASHEDGTLSVQVKDTGIGMDENTTQRIFQPFERAAPDLDSEGFGLGLSITKGLVNLFGGRLSVSSQVGKGSEFKVEIPLRQTNEPAKDNSQPDAGSLRLPRRVLVVDDDPIQLRNTVEMMERNGISCRACINAQEVVKALRTGEYDLLLTDIQMRGTGGFDLLHLLRLSNIGNSRTIPIAAMTARNDGDADRYIQAGFAGCIHKPFYTRDLLEFLSSLIGQDRTMDNHSPDFEALYVTTGDERWTLETLIEESNRNSSDLLDSLSQEKPDRKRIWETLHRMYPMWEQLGIAHELEPYSYEHYAEDTDEPTFRNDVERIVRRIDRLISETKSRLSEMDGHN